MSDDEKNSEIVPDPATDNNAEPQQEPPTPPPQNSKTVTTLVAIILVLLAIIVGGALYTMTRGDSSPGKSSNSVSALGTDDKAATPNSRSTTNKPLQTGIKTSEPDFEVQLDSIKPSTHSVIVNFSVVCVKNTNARSDCYTGDLWNEDEALAATYLLDDKSQQKYEVTKDASNRAFVSDTTQHAQKWMTYKDKVGYYATVAKPAKGSEVTAYIPGVQPITGVVITK